MNNNKHNCLCGLLHLVCTIVALSLSLFALVTYVNDTSDHLILIMGCIVSLATIKLGLHTFEFYYDYCQGSTSEQHIPLLVTSVSV